MSVEPLVCVECGVVWQSKPEAHSSAMSGGCLVCGGRLVPSAEVEGEGTTKPEHDEPPPSPDA